MQRILVYWRDIPAQVIIKRGRSKGKAVLGQRFQEAIDHAAMRAGRGDADDYITDWRRDTAALQGDGDVQELASQEVARLESLYSEQRLAQLVANAGIAES